jgi:hypothetical protein
MRATPRFCSDRDVYEEQADTICRLDTAAKCEQIARVPYPPGGYGGVQETAGGRRAPSGAPSEGI